MVLAENTLDLLEMNTLVGATATKMTMTNKNIGQTVRTALLSAKYENRLVIGLSNVAKMLSKTPEDTVICIMAQPNVGDSATHMHEVLLEAFCYENDIYLIKVDNSDKLSRLIGCNSQTTESCVLVQKIWLTTATADVDEIDGNNNNNNQKKTIYSPVETALIDYCEEYWDNPKQPIIQLPES